MRADAAPIPASKADVLRDLLDAVYAAPAKMPADSGTAGGSLIDKLLYSSNPIRNANKHDLDWKPV
jgi:hypothetical protein